MTTILISSSNKTVRENVKAILELKKDLHLVTCCDQDDEIFTKTEILIPQFIVVDLMINYTEGLSRIKRIKKRYSSMKIIAVTFSNDQNIMIDAFKCGINGYLLKEGLFEELHRCIYTLLLDEIYISHKIINNVVNYYVKTPQKELKNSYLLSQKEIDHIRHIANGKYSKEIAQIMNISKKTADNYRTRIMKKLELNSIADIVKYALREQIIHL